MWEAVKTKSVSAHVLSVDSSQGGCDLKSCSQEIMKVWHDLCWPHGGPLLAITTVCGAETPYPYYSATNHLYLRLTGSGPMRKERCLLRNWLHISFSLHISCSGHGASAHVFLVQTGEERGGMSPKEKSYKVRKFFENQALFEVPPLFQVSICSSLTNSRWAALDIII